MLNTGVQTNAIQVHQQSDMQAVKLSRVISRGRGGMIKWREGRTGPRASGPSSSSYTLDPSLAQEALFGHIYSPKPTFSPLGSSLALSRRSRKPNSAPASAS